MITMTITHQNYNANENLITKHEEEFKNWTHSLTFYGITIRDLCSLLGDDNMLQ
jgi:hypothetical protein